MKIGEVRSKIDELNWARQEFTGGTREENRRTDLSGILGPLVATVESLEIPARFTRDIEAREHALEAAATVLQRWEQSREVPKDDANDVAPVPVLFDVFVKVKVANLNKQNTLDEYIELVNANDYLIREYKVVEIATLTDKQYSVFATSLLTDRAWLAGKGGTSSRANLCDFNEVWELSDDEMARYRAESYDVCIAVQCAGKRTIYVDPQGYNYARYVGLE